MVDVFQHEEGLRLKAQPLTQEPGNGLHIYGVVRENEGLYWKM